MMSHSAQVILAIGVAATLSLTAWCWARHRLTGFHIQKTDKIERDWLAVDGFPAGSRFLL
jgi:hypothetical protein